MARVLTRSILAASALAMALAGCASGPMIDGIPSSIGLPAEAPARPATPYEYPAVHDMPPPRPVRIMTEEQQIKLEKELATVRDRQAAREGTGKKTAGPGKKKPAAADDGEAAGTKTNP